MPAHQRQGQDVIAIDRSGSSNFCCLHSGNKQLFIAVFWRQQNSRFRSDFRKFASVTMLWSIIRILHASLVQIDTEMAEKYANQRNALSSHWKICHRMCVSINGPGDLDL